MSGKHILLFDLTNHAHFPMFLRYWLRYWNASDRRGHLSILVSRSFVRSHPDLVQLGSLAPRGNVSFLTPTAVESKELAALARDPASRATSFVALLRGGAPGQYAGLFAWELFCRYSAERAVDVSVMCHIDHYLPVLISRAAAPAATAGIFFAAKFYYDQVPDIADRLIPEERPEILQQRFVIARALQHPNLKRLLLLDPYARDWLRRYPSFAKTTYLPEPVGIDRNADLAAGRDRRDALGIEQSRQVLLVVGHLAARKGADLLLRALAFAPPELSAGLCLLLAGHIDEEYRRQLDVQIESLLETHPLQVVRRYDYVPDEQLPAYLSLADLIVTLYRRHAGPSNILLLAAAAHRPVLSSDYGLMGRTVREQGLGLAVDVEDVDAVLRALKTLLDRPGLPAGEASRLDSYVAEHTPDLFATTFFGALDQAD